MTNAFIAFTDGSASTKDRSGGWAVVVLNEEGEEINTLDGWESDTTISRMELTGPAIALGCLWAMFGPSLVVIYSDSQYVIKGINENHKRRINQDKWEVLDNAIEHHVEVQFEHVRGHAGHDWNERADNLAGAARLRGIGKARLDSIK